MGPIAKDGYNLLTSMWGIKRTLVLWKSALRRAHLLALCSSKRTLGAWDTPDPITRLNAALEGSYRIEREIGEGGMTTVYLADDLKHERKVALKMPKPEFESPRVHRRLFDLSVRGSTGAF